MRVVILTLGLIALAMPAFANCGATHEASSSDTVATTTAPPPATPSSGG